MKNNGWVIMTVRVLIGVIVLGIGAILTVQHQDIQANDKLSRSRDSEIQAEAIERDDDIKREAILSERRIFAVLDEIKQAQHENFIKILDRL